MNLIKPKKLKSGDTITFIAPSGNLEEKYVINAKKYFEQKGFKVKTGENILGKDRYMAASDDKRLEDLHNAFLDNETDAILCLRGGYGALRLIQQIDYELIKNNPKIFCGYSDITALSLMFLKKSNLITFSSPMPKGDFQYSEVNEYTQNKFFEVLSSDCAQIIPQNLKTYKQGEAHGILLGGNLVTAASLCGIDFVPDEEFIFFTEDLNEPVYKIDRYFRQLLNVDAFKKNMKALILGDFLDVDKPEQLEYLFSELAQELQIPVLGGYKISHSAIKDTLPVGGFAKIDKNGIIQVEY